MASIHQSVKCESLWIRDALADLKQCTRSRDLDRGREVHLRVVKRGLLPNTYLANALINMYSKCGSMLDAHRVFESMRRPDIVSWNSLLQGYVDNGHAQVCLEMAEASLACTSDGFLDSRTYAVLVSACASMVRLESEKGSADKWLAKGMDFHSQALLNRCCNAFVENVLIRLYSSAREMARARQVFDSMAKHSVVSWTVLLQGYVENGEYDVVLELFGRMEEVEVSDARTYVIALTACTALAAIGRANILEKGVEIHERALEGRCCNMYVGTAAIDMFSSCKEMARAQSVFDKMSNASVVPWNSLILGYVENGESLTALELFDSMEEKNIAPTSRTYVAALAACSSLAGTAKKASEEALSEVVSKGKYIHSRVVANGKCLNTYVENMLITMYASFVDMPRAVFIFESMKEPDTVTWNALLQAFVDSGENNRAVELFRVMEHERCCVPDCRTYACVLTACFGLVNESGSDGSREEWLDKARALHSQAVNTSNCNVYVWNALAQGYVETGRSRLALQTIAEMDLDGVEPDVPSFVAGLNACGESLDLDTGRIFHEEITNSMKLRNSPKLSTCLVKFYGKVGETGVAEKVFRSMASRDVEVWNALLCGYSHRGDAENVLKRFGEMEEQGVIPDEVSFALVLNACSHGGLTHRAREMFETMQVKYEITPGVVHYTCMADSLARAECVHQALELVGNMPLEADSVALMASRWPITYLNAINYYYILKSYFSIL